MKATNYTNKELVEIYKNLKTSAKILGFSSASDSEMIAEIEIEAIKRHLNLVDGTVEETAEIETAKPETAETDDSGFEYYSVKVAYEVIKDEMRSVLFLGYSLALKVAEDFTDTWGGDKAIITAVSLIIRNDRQPESERDKRILETETAEIERRCVPYHDLGLSGYVSIEDRQDIA